MVADYDLDLTIFDVELDGILKDVEQNLLVHGPVSAGPVGNEICLGYFDRDFLLIQCMVKGWQELCQSLTECLTHRLKVVYHLVEV